MGIITLSALVSNWRSKHFAPVYVFAERNTFEKDVHIAKLSQILFPQGLTPFNHDSFSMPQATVQDILNSALMLPFSNGKRLVVVKSIQELTSAQEKMLAENIGHMPETTVLVLESNEARKDIQKRLIVKSVLKIGDVVYFWPPRVQDVHRIINQRVVEAGKNISPEAARFIAEGVGDDQSQLIMEIEKLLVYCRDAKVIGLKDAAEVCGQTAVHNLFELRDSLQAHNVEKSVGLVEHLLHERINAVEIINSLYQTYRRLFVAMLMVKEKKRSREDVTPALGINPYYDKHFFQDLNHFTFEEIIHCLESIKEADMAVKTGKADPESVLTILILKISGSHELLKFQGEA